MTDASAFADMFQLLGRLPQALQRRMVGMYLDAMATQLQLLQQALAEGDWTRSEAVAHKLAGSAGMMQDALLSQAAREVENLLREDLCEAAVERWAGIAQRAAVTRRALQEAYPGSA